MASAIEDFIQKFHNLSGITLFERQRSFNHYLTELKKAFTSMDDKKELVKQLKPTNRLEDVFYTTVLLELEENEGLLNILYSNDVMLRKMALNSDAFMKEMYEIIVVDDFSSEVCFVVRLRILIRLGEILQDDDRLDKYYQLIRKKYGLHMAKNLLPGCKLDTITQEMKKNRVLFNLKQLTKIYKRFPDFLEKYFDHLTKNNYKWFGAFDKLIRHIALTNADLYWTLLNKFNLKTKLSRKSTAKLMSKHCDEILLHGENYIDILHKNTAFKLLSIDEFKTFYSKLFPNYLTDLTRETFNGPDKDVIKCLSKRLPSGLRFSILNDVFKNLYNSDILDHDDLFTEELLEIVPANLRETIITKHIEKDWLCFHELDKAQSILRERISMTSDVTKRYQYIVLLVKACKVNKNTQRLIEVLQFINARYRNEDAATFHKIFEYLLKFELTKFNAEHWEEINRMIRIFLITKHNEFYYSEDLLNKVFEGYFDFRIRENLPIEEEVLKYLKLYYKDYHLMLFRSREGQQKHKMILNMCAEIIPKTFMDNDLCHASSFYLQSIVDYNKDYPRDWQDLTKHDFIVKYIHDVMEDSSHEDCFGCYIFKGINNLKHNKEVYKKVADTLWSSSPEQNNLQWLYFIKNDPQYCVQHYEKFFQNCWDNKGAVGYEDLVQYYSHLGLPQLYEAKSKEYICQPELRGYPYRFEVALKFLVYSEDFLEITERFLPKEDYDNRIEEEEVNVITIKKTLGALFGQHKHLQKVLKPLIALSKSDYLRYCLQSIYKVSYNMPESKLVEFLQDIELATLESLTKYHFFIVTTISTQQRVYKTLKRKGETEELNSIIRKCLFNSTLNYFNLNPSDEVFELVKDHCWLINFRDTEGHDMWLNFDKIPVQYLVKYVKFLWKFTQDNDHEPVRNLKYKILEKLDEERMKHFTQNFLHRIVTECVNFELSDDNTEKIYGVLYRFIISGKGKNLSGRLNVITSQFPKDISDCNVKVTKNLLKFTTGFCEAILKERKQFNYESKTILEQYKKSWQEIYNAENNFEQYTHLKLTEYSCENDLKYDNHQLIKNITCLLREITENFGTYVIPNFASIFLNYFATLMRIEVRQNEEELFKFVVEFLENQEGQNLQRNDMEYFALLCLPKVFPKATNSRLNHLKILEILKKTKSKSIRISVRCYINSQVE